MKKGLAFALILFLLLPLLSACGARNTQAVRLLEIPLTRENYAFGVDKNQPELLSQANDFIAQIRSDGTLDAICDKYFAGGEPAPVVSAQPNPTKDQLTVATSTPFAPFEYLQGESYYGVDMEIAAAFADYLGQELVIYNMDFPAVCLSVEQGKCDLAMAGLTVTDDRQASVSFTAPYYEASQILVLPADDLSFDHCITAQQVEEALRERGSGLRIGVQTGTTGQFYVEGDEDWGFEGLDATCVGYRSGALAVQNMLDGALDYVILDKAPASQIAASFNGGDGDSGRTFREKLENFGRIFLKEGGWRQVLQGLKNTAVIAVAGLCIGVCIGTVIAAVGVMPKYKRLPRLLDGLCRVYVGFFRGTPIVVQLLLCYYVLLPALGLHFSSLAVCVAVFGMNSGAYVSEIMRGGIASVDKGQLEAGRAVGLSFGTSMLRIVIPQAVKNILPTLGNEFISLIKETSVVSFVGTLDIYVAFDRIGSNDYEYMVPYLAMALIYILLVAAVSALVKWMDRRLSKSDRHSKSK